MEGTLLQVHTLKSIHPAENPGQSKVLSIENTRGGLSKNSNNNIQTHKMFKRTLLGQNNNLHIFGDQIYQELNSQNDEKLDEKLDQLSVFG